MSTLGDDLFQALLVARPTFTARCSRERERHLLVEVIRHDGRLFTRAKVAYTWRDAIIENGAAAELPPFRQPRGALQVTEIDMVGGPDTVPAACRCRTWSVSVAWLLDQVVAHEHHGIWRPPSNR